MTDVLPYSILEPRQIKPYLVEFSLLITTKNTESTKKKFNKRFVLIFNGLFLRVLRELCGLQ